jgi:formylglycine-generating enzyme required for sulfatase activity
MQRFLTRFRRHSRRFTVLGRHFEVPRLDLAPRMRAADRTRRRARNPGIMGVFDRFRSRDGRISLGFRRSHAALDAQDDVVLAALDHAAAHGEALTQAAAWIAAEARRKLAQLAAQARERQQLAASLRRAPDEALARDLETVAGHMRQVARTAAICLARLMRYRGFADRWSETLADHARELADLRTGLVHEEQTWRWRQRLERDTELAGWTRHADALCAGIEVVLAGLHQDLAGIERQLHDIPVSFGRFLEGDLAVSPTLPDEAVPAAIPRLSELPSHLDEADWALVSGEDFEAELAFEGADLATVQTRAAEWLEGWEQTALVERGTPPCGACGAPVASRATRGRAHLLCRACRAEAPSALPTVRLGHLEVGRTPVTRGQFDRAIGFVPERQPGRELAALPVSGLSWLEAVAFCNARSRLDHSPEAYRIRGRRVELTGQSGGWRLPTLAEWRTFATPDMAHVWWRESGAAAWHADLTPPPTGPRAVDKAVAGPLGLVDALGNVASWLWAAPGEETGLKGSTTDERLAAGGSWMTTLAELGPDAVVARVLEARDPTIGLRVVREVPTPPRAPAPAHAAVGQARVTPPRPPAPNPGTPPLRVRAPTVLGQQLIRTLAVLINVAVFGGLIVFFVVPHLGGDLEPAPSPGTATPAFPAVEAPPSPVGEAMEAPPSRDPLTRSPRAQNEARLDAALAGRVAGTLTGAKLRAELEAIAAEDPNLPAVHLALARELVRAGRLREAGKALAGLRAIDADGDREEAQRLLAIAQEDPALRRVRMP